MRRTTPPNHARDPIADAVTTIALRVSGTEQRRALLGTIADRLAAVVRTAGGACAAAASGNTNAAVGALQAFGGTVETVALEVEGALTERDGRIAALEAEATAARTRVDALEGARVQLQASVAVERERAVAAARAERAALEQELAHVDAQRVRVETLLATSASEFTHTLTAFCRALLERADAHLAEVIARERTLARLEDDVNALEALERVTIAGPEGDEQRTLDEEVVALAADVAPIRAAYHAIAPEQLTGIEHLRERYRVVCDQYHELERLVATLGGELEEQDAAHRKASVAWAETERDLLAAAHLFPRVFAADPFALAGTTNAEVQRKRAAYAEVQQQCAVRMGHIQHAMGIANVRYAATCAALEQSEADIERLLAHHDASAYDALPEDAQRRIRAAVLAFRPKDRSLSVRGVAGILARAGACPDGDDGLAVAAAALASAHFEPAAPAALQERMQVFRLTELGRYWREVWIGSDPAFAEAVADARRHWEADLAAAEAAGVQERDLRRMARESERATRRTERALAVKQRAERATARERPAAIVARLSDAERDVLAVIVAVAPALRDTPYANDWTRAIVTGVASGAMGATPARAAATALRRLLAFRPALLEPSTTRRGTVEPTALALRVAELLPTIPSDPLRVCVEHAQGKVKYWDAEYRDLYHRIEGLLTPMTGRGTTDGNGTPTSR